jgi:hypothetical protein
MTRQWLTALLCTAVLAGTPAQLFAADKDPLPDVRDRMKVEAQRVEKEFTEGRAAAYKLVRAADPKLVEATEKLETLLAMVRRDNSLDAKRRKVLIVTLEWDLDKVKEIAGERRRTSSSGAALSRAARSDIRRDDNARRTTDGNSVVRGARSVIESRSRSLEDYRDDRRRSGDRFNRVMASTAKSAIPENRNVTFPKDWVEKSRKRTAGIKMTAKEKQIMKALSTTIDAEFSENHFEDVIDWLKKATKCEIIVDKRGLDESSVTYKTPITLKLKSSTRTVLKRILADLGLAYIVKDEAIQITSRERARQETTTRTYYIGDLAATVDVTLPWIFQQQQMLENIDRIIKLVTGSIESQSWKVNNPDAPGTIVFEPITMSLVVKQTAEIHFMLGGK